MHPLLYLLPFITTTSAIFFGALPQFNPPSYASPPPSTTPEPYREPTCVCVPEPPTLPPLPTFPPIELPTLPPITPIELPTFPPIELPTLGPIELPTFPPIEFPTFPPASYAQSKPLYVAPAAYPTAYATPPPMFSQNIIAGAGSGEAHMMAGAGELPEGLQPIPPVLPSEMDNGIVEPVEGEQLAPTGEHEMVEEAEASFTQEVTEGPSKVESTDAY